MTQFQPSSLERKVVELRRDFYRILRRSARTRDAKPEEKEQTRGNVCINGDCPQTCERVWASDAAASLARSSGVYSSKWEGVALALASSKYQEAEEQQNLAVGSDAASEDSLRRLHHELKHVKDLEEYVEESEDDQRQHEWWKWSKQELLAKARKMQDFRKKQKMTLKILRRLEREANDHIDCLRAAVRTCRSVLHDMEKKMTARIEELEEYLEVAIETSCSKLDMEGTLRVVRETESDKLKLYNAEKQQAKAELQQAQRAAQTANKEREEMAKKLSGLEKQHRDLQAQADLASSATKKLGMLGIHMADRKNIETRQVARSKVQEETEEHLPQPTTFFADSLRDLTRELITDDS
ncbi:hypothetical protein GUITHDRAFT_120519 [Guillardia theta CCMP2712]|uniref:Uncharacterized protein n=1 Tax=Guillardia theta (strain CCMP2712) TaxID=905079 RepID=L1IBV7_GUITC|nr:hypothetical protein GUITHDRAFT_120519 [Guillardia theta CCMP2712]EKX33305.1 hypothetical protein GUITHDRAFT_120519 [Guillardia theta CCMP2712]|eukprot:XP_005820285.1 hypothetical protein GUITHDRAFT_120519 [Guillardia theta CCMP2712]